MVSLKECISLMQEFEDVKVFDVLENGLILRSNVTEECSINLYYRKGEVDYVEWTDDSNWDLDTMLYSSSFSDEIDIEEVKIRLTKSMKASLDYLKKKIAELRAQ
jgi:hypothetical protein